MIINVSMHRLIILLLCAHISSYVYSMQYRFNVITRNMLAEDAYRRGYNHAVGTRGIMPLATRTNFLKTFLNAVPNNSLLALQENDHYLLPSLMNRGARLFYDPNELGLTVGYKGPWHIVGSKYLRFSRLPAANKPGKGFLPVIVTPIDQHGRLLHNHSIMVIDTHFMFGGATFSDYAKLRIRQAQAIAHYIRQFKNNIRYFIIAGDFNTASEKHPALYYEILKILSSSGIPFADASLELPTKRASTLYHGLLSNVDYIFYSNNLRLINPVPPTPNNLQHALISHGFGSGDPRSFHAIPDQHRKFFSDHLSLMATFELPITTRPPHLPPARSCTHHRVTPSHPQPVYPLQRQAPASRHPQPRPPSRPVPIPSLPTRFAGINAPYGHWGMQIQGTTINGFNFTRHVLERMAPDTPAVRNELNKRRSSLYRQHRLTPQEYKDYIKPRNISPATVINTIWYGRKKPSRNNNTVIHMRNNIAVVTDPTGKKVITTYPLK